MADDQAVAELEQFLAEREMSGVPVPASHWSSFIDSTLACGAASVTGHVWIDGQETTKITGVPVTERLQPGEARAVGEKWVRGEWTLYVNPETYLPVRIASATSTFGGPRASTRNAAVTDVRLAGADRRQHRSGDRHHPARLPSGELAGQPVDSRPRRHGLA